MDFSIPMYIFSVETCRFSLQIWLFYLETYDFSLFPGNIRLVRTNIPRRHGKMPLRTNIYLFFAETCDFSSQIFLCSANICVFFGTNVVLFRQNMRLSVEIFNNICMRLSGISRIIKAEVRVILPNRKASIYYH